MLPIKTFSKKRSHASESQTKWILLTDTNPIVELIYALRRLEKDNVISSIKVISEIKKNISGRIIMLKYTDGVSVKRIFLNSRVTDKLQSMLVHGGDLSFEASKMTEYIGEVFISKMYDMEIYENVIGGARFEYTNNSNIDLIRYQIYRLNQAPMDDTHCLLRALRLHGIDTSPVDTFVGQDIFPVNKLTDVASKLGININLYVLNKTGKIISSKKPRDITRPIIANICLYRNHYMIQEKTGIPILGNARHRFHTTLSLISDLDKQGLFTYNLDQAPIIRQEALKLSSILGEQKPFVKPSNFNSSKTFTISYADIECAIRPIHVPIMYGRYTNGKYYMTSTGYDDDWSGMKCFLNSFPHGHNVVYFHNLKYDWSVIKKCPHINIQSMVKKDGLYYSVTFRFFKRVFELRDSYKLIPKKLSDFTTAFNIPDIQKHSYILYELYTKENTKGITYVSYKDYKLGDLYEYSYNISNKPTKFTTPITDVERYIIIDERIVVDRVIISLCSKYFINGIYFHLAHCEYYLHSDCKLLFAGLEKYRTMMIGVIGIDCHTKLTLPSIVHRKISLDGCYDGVCELTDSLRIFVAKSVHGGRVCTRDNKMWDISGKLHVLDGRSLYPSAIVRLCSISGFPIGPATIIKDWSEKKTFSHYVIKINLFKINKPQQIPFVSYYHNDSRIYTNTVPKEGYLNNIIVDKITLEDWIMFQDIEYQFIEGICWTEGYNALAGTFVRNLYSSRREYAASGNIAMSEICKLALNSLYGKTIVKPNIVRTVVRQNESVNDYIVKNFENLIDMEECHNQSILTISDDGVGHANMAHIGGMILSMARRIMNELLDIANTIGVVVTYTDTDSAHIVGDPKHLEDAYMFKYKKTLLGTSLGQFSLELKYPGHTDIHSIRTIVLGKKVYLHIVQGTTPDGIIETYTHIRIKGINTHAIKEYPDHIALYEKLYNGGKVAFNLAYGDATIFDFKNSVTTRDSFIKNISFDGEKGVLDTS